MPIISGFPAGGNAKFPEGGKTDQVLVKTEEGEAWGNVKTVAEKATQKPISFQVTGLEGEEFTIEFTEDGEGGSGGVESFNGRSGAVVPQTGDYTAEMVGAIDQTEKGRASGVASLDTDGKVPAGQLPEMNYDPAGSAQTVQQALNTHAANKTLHVTAAERQAWNNKAAGTHTHTAAQVGAVPNTRTVNGKPLSADVALSAADVGARPSSWTPSASEVGALPVGGGTLTGNLRIKNGSNYGMKLNFGDSEYVYLHESTDDNLDIKAKTINFLCTNLRQNGTDIGGSNVVVGTYTGSCSDGQTQSITLGFRPKFVIVYHGGELFPWTKIEFEDYDDVEYKDLYYDFQEWQSDGAFIMDGFPIEAKNGDYDDDTYSTMVVGEITSTGFKVGQAYYRRTANTSSRDYNYRYYCDLASSGQSYVYVAFR